MRRTPRDTDATSGRVTRRALIIGGGMAAMVTALGARMRLIVNNGQMLEIEMCINLRRGDAGVTEHFLYGTQITGCLQEMRGK